jgi:uncharacterized protein (DUF2336 family)
MVGWITQGGAASRVGKGMRSNAEAVIGQFGAALTSVSGEARCAAGRELTELFVAGAGSYSARQLAIFDRLMAHLIELNDRAGRIELATMLAQVDDAPLEAVAKLSNDDDILIAAPLLARSQALTDEQLMAVVRGKTQNHLAAIAERSRISEPVVDVLMERGAPVVIRKVVTNLGARLSEMAFAKIISDARKDKALAAALACRKDIPAELLPFLKAACA